VTRAGQ